jgi:predicted double-glycine peptidase
MAKSAQSSLVDDRELHIQKLEEQITQLQAQLLVLQRSESTTPQTKAASVDTARLHTSRKVPFYSQFTDISKAGWQKIGCGIASVAMLIDYYSNRQINVDQLLEKGIANNAYLSDAGWIHAGLINLTHEYGLDGQSKSLAHLSADNALTALSKVVANGPVMASVHYTFEPTNPIPHLVVINEIKDGKVYYNDPAEATGNGSLSFEQFKRGWKQRYIVIRPV